MKPCLKTTDLLPGILESLLRLSINVILYFLFTALSLVINSVVTKLSSVGILPASVSVHWCALGPAGSQKVMSDPMELSYGCCELMCGYWESILPGRATRALPLWATLQPWTHVLYTHEDNCVLCLTLCLRPAFSAFHKEADSQQSASLVFILTKQTWVIGQAESCSWSFRKSRFDTFSAWCSYLSVTVSVAHWCWESSVGRLDSGTGFRTKLEISKIEIFDLGSSGLYQNIFWILLVLKLRKY